MSETTEQNAYAEDLILQWPVHRGHSMQVYQKSLQKILDKVLIESSNNRLIIVLDQVGFIPDM